MFQISIQQDQSFSVKLSQNTNAIHPDFSFSLKVHLEQNLNFALVQFIHNYNAILVQNIFLAS